MLPFYTAWLSVENYGDIDLVGTYVSLIMGVVTLCITDAIFRFPQGKSIDKQRTFFSSGLTVVSLSLILFGAVYYYLLKYVEDIQWGVFGSYAGYIYVLLIFSFLQLYLQQFSRSIDRICSIRHYFNVCYGYIFVIISTQVGCGRLHYFSIDRFYYFFFIHSSFYTYTYLFIV